MNDSSPQPELPAVSMLAMSRAVRFALASIVVGFSYLNIHCAFGMGQFEQIWADMIGSKPLPAITTFVLYYQPTFAVASILLPVAAIVSIFPRHPTRYLYVSGTLVLLVFLQLFLQWTSLTAPMETIIRGMQGQ